MMPKDLSELSNERLEEIINSKMVQKYLAYEQLAAGIEALKDDDVMFDQLISGINDRYGRVSEDTIEDVLNSFVDEVKTNTVALEKAEEDEDKGF